MKHVLLAAALLCALLVRAGEPAAPRVEIYTAKSCGYCRALRAYLNLRGIAYIEHDINQTLETREAFYRMGGIGTPTVVIDGRMIHGFDPLRIEAALDEAKAPAGG